MRHTKRQQEGEKGSAAVKKFRTSHPNANEFSIKTVLHRKTYTPPKIKVLTPDQLQARLTAEAVAGDIEAGKLLALLLPPRMRQEEDAATAWSAG